MAEIRTAKVSATGQVVIPAAIRTKLGLKPGARFVVLGKGNTIVLRPIAKPSMREFTETVEQAREAARRAGVKKSDVAAAVVDARLAGDSIGAS